MQKRFWAIWAVCLLAPALVAAQFFPPGPYVGGFVGPGTAASSYQFGLSEVVRSSADANLMNSIATQNLQAARAQDIENRVRWTEAYYEMRRANRAYRAAKRGPRLSQEEIARVARAGMPKRLTSEQLDPLTGDLNWPIILREEQYAPERKQLDTLFSDRAATSMTSWDATQTVRSVTDELLAALKNNINDYRSADWIAAKKFVDSLAYEARFPAG